MFDSLVPRVIAAKLTSALCRYAVGSRKISIKFPLAAIAVPALLVCNVATAQVTGMASPTPTIGMTSPLSMGAGSPVSPAGIPLGSTEIVSPGISPAPADATGTIATSSGATCSTLGSAPSSMFGSTASFDGGGMSLGLAQPAAPARGDVGLRQA